MALGIWKTSAWAVSLGGVVFGTVALAEEEPFALDPGVVFYLPTGGEGPISRAASTTQVITSEDFSRRGARTLGEALTFANGVNVRFGGDGTRRNCSSVRSGRLVQLCGVARPTNASVRPTTSNHHQCRWPRSDGYRCTA